MFEVGFVKVHNLNDIIKLNFDITDISAIYQTPVYKYLDMNSREYNGFLLIDKGECHYTWEGGYAKLSPGDIIYLPFGSKHRLDIKTEEFSFYRVNFTISDRQGERIVFSHKPMVVLNDADFITANIIKELSRLFLQTNRNFKIKSLMYELLDSLENKLAIDDISIARKMISYISNNYTKEISPEELQKISLISIAQMYRLFKKETGLSPIEYRNKLRVSRAKALLRSNACTVGEIGEMLGFESIYYFSRVFKKYTGVSPSKYSVTQNKNQ